MIDKESETIKFKRFLENNQKGTIKVEFDENNIKSEYLSQISSEVFNLPKENKIMNFFFGRDWRTKGVWKLLKEISEGVLAIIGLIALIKWIL